jgi:hypothetical protein
VRARNSKYIGIDPHNICGGKTFRKAECKWEDNITCKNISKDRCEFFNFTQVTGDKVHWRSFVNSVII